MLEADGLEQLADLIAERLRRTPLRRLLTAAEVADYLSVDAGFVYANAAAMDARRLGNREGWERILKVDSGPFPPCERFGG